MIADRRDTVPGMGDDPARPADPARPKAGAAGDRPLTRAWQGGRVAAEGFAPAAVSDWLERPDTVVWLDVCAPDHADLRLIAEELGLDPFSVEDAMTHHERAKLDRYDSYLFLNMYATGLDDAGIQKQEISAFVTRRALVTVRQDAGFDMAGLLARWDTSPELTEHGAIALLHGLLDMVVDGHLDTLQRLDDESEDLEETIFDGDDVPLRQVQQRSFLLRKRLVETRRAVLPMGQIVDGLLRRAPRNVPEELTGHFRDVYDHATHAAEWADSLRETVGNLLDARISIQSNRLNEVMKKVTSWAAIIAVPTAVTGFYGQNVPYPGSQAHWGFVTSTVVMVVCSLGLYAVFKVKDWL